MGGRGRRERWEAEVGGIEFSILYVRNILG